MAASNEKHMNSTVEKICLIKKTFENRERVRYLRDAVSEITEAIVLRLPHQRFQISLTQSELHVDGIGSISQIIQNLRCCCQGKDDTNNVTHSKKSVKLLLTVSKSLGERSMKIVESLASAAAAALLAAAAAIKALSPCSHKKDPGTAQSVRDVVSNKPPPTFSFTRHGGNLPFEMLSFGPVAAL